MSARDKEENEQRKERNRQMWADRKARWEAYKRGEDPEARPCSHCGASNSRATYQLSCRLCGAAFPGGAS